MRIGIIAYLLLLLPLVSQSFLSTPPFSLLSCCREPSLHAETETGSGEESNGEGEVNMLMKSAWYGAEQAGRAMAMKEDKKPPPGVFSAKPPVSMDEAVNRIKSDCESSTPYFITGVIDAACYDDMCMFADPFVSFKGRARFEDNLKNLGGFIKGSEIRILSSEVDQNELKTKYVVSLELSLPWNPVLKWPWGVTHVLEPRSSDGAVVVTKHIEEWDVEPQEGIRQLFSSGKAKRGKGENAASNSLGTKDPIAGPLVALARSIGLLPEAEDDGWTGEPSSWASSDSLPQRLSEASQKYLKGFKQFVAEIVAGDFDADAIDDAIEREVSENGVIMYSFTSCPFCKAAKSLLDSRGAKYTVVELDSIPDGAARRARLGRITGRTSVPSVFIGGVCVGGMNDGNPGLKPMDEAGVLDERLREAGAL